MYIEVSKLLGDHSDSDEPDFGQQTPEEDTFQRDGPLRIPTDLIEVPYIRGYGSTILTISITAG